MIWNKKKNRINRSRFFRCTTKLREKNNTKNVKKKVNHQYICKQIVKSSSTFNKRYIKNNK